MQRLWHVTISCIVLNHLTTILIVKEKLYPLLLNLVTTTDEITIFATAEVVNSKETFYLLSRPEEHKYESYHSGARNHYKKKLMGNVYWKGVHIVINSLFNATCLPTPIFICVYGMIREEIVVDEMITISVHVLAFWSHIRLTFMRGNDGHSSNTGSKILH